MRILLLGGSGFVSGEVARQGVAAGHDVTCLTRGRHPLVDGADWVRGDRDEPDGLRGLEGEHFDAAVDVTSQPGLARAAAASLAVDHWVYVSSLNAYAEGDRRHDPLAGDRMMTMEEYGPAKVACEDAYLAATDGRATIARAGLIGGPGDVTGRSAWWSWRFRHPVDGRVLVPSGGSSVQLVDVRDLAAWLLQAAAQRISAAVDVVGEVTPLATALDLAAAGSDAERVPVGDDWALAHGITPWMGPDSWPLWLPHGDDSDVIRPDGPALDLGLRRRPLAETLRDAGADAEARDRSTWLAGLSDDTERALLREVVGD